ARHLYRWIPGDGGTVTALVLTGGETKSKGEEKDGGAPGVDKKKDKDSPSPPGEGVRVIRVDGGDPSLGGGAFPAVPPPQKEGAHRNADVDFWQDDEGAIRGWILLPAEGEEPQKVAAPTSAQGPAHRLLPVASRRGGRAAGVRIDASGHLT